LHTYASYFKLNTVLLQVGDVAAAIAKSVDNAESVGKVVELYGPRAYRYQSIIDFFLDITKRDPLVWPCPKLVAKYVGPPKRLRFLSCFLPLSF
jgi:uncharacterized protein YbjT (DUF2867 family)